MCMVGKEVTDVIDNIVDSWISQGRAFTAYEVSKEVQSRLKADNQPFVRHKDMVSYYRDNECVPLRDVLQDFSYVSTLVNVGNNLQATLFHPYNYDPSQYVPLSRDKGVGNPSSVPASNISHDVNAVQTNTISSVVPSPSNGNGKPQVDVANVNKSGEVWIGCGHVQVAGWKTGDDVTFRVSNDQIVITTFDPTVDGLQIKRTVEKYGNLRIYPQDRASAGFNGVQFRVKSSPGKIVIEA